MASIRKIGDGEYFVRVSKGTGKGRVFINKKIRGTLKQAQAFAREKEGLLDLGHSPHSIKLTFSEYFKKWLKAVEKKVGRPTWEGYERIIKNHALDQLGPLRLSDIKTHHIQSVLDEKTDLQPITVINIRTALSACFSYAVKQEYRKTNPVKNSEAPRKTSKEKIVMDFDEAKRFMEACQGARYGLVFELGLETGMRPEEYLALRWKDIDFHRNKISVSQALVYKQKGGGFHFKETKTKKSRRLIPISIDLRNRLMQHRREQNEIRLKAKTYKSYDLVFPSSIGTPMNYANLVWKYFNPMLEELGFRKGGVKIKNLTPYSLRHTCATLLLMAGVNPKVVADRLGHSSVAITLDTYSHVLPSIQEEATNELDNILRPKFVQKSS